jgi:hypothetical protein
LKESTAVLPVETAGALDPESGSKWLRSSITNRLIFSLLRGKMASIGKIPPGAFSVLNGVVCKGSLEPDLAVTGPVSP